MIVAAGLSSRMREFKPLPPVGDSSLIRRIASSFRAAGVSDIAVVTGHNAEALREHLSGLGTACLRNEDYAASDMFSSVRIGLGYIGDRCGRAFLTPVDVPVFDAAGLPR
ncbi:MAG TPA: NTP transferase domain-containing protein [Spirochaetales bacterium]|nr:NTP transferase domain-containing protein [Spirochaetales bacterium]HRY55864.1 NTP transferase domain-containing protein [Spirochaetia bacterium]HRZ65413.1 NTP transferase domain-containing protein [Spirochaetia bacterium]